MEKENVMILDYMAQDEHFAATLIEQCSTGDPESDHFIADKILISLLELLKFEKTKKAYENIGKWYA